MLHTIDVLIVAWGWSYKPGKKGNKVFVSQSIILTCQHYFLCCIYTLCCDPQLFHPIKKIGSVNLFKILLFLNKQSLKLGERKKSLGAKSGEQDGWGAKSEPNSITFSIAIIDVWIGALSLRKSTFLCARWQFQMIQQWTIIGSSYYCVFFKLYFEDFPLWMPDNNGHHITIWQNCLCPLWWTLSIVVTAILTMELSHKSVHKVLWLWLNIHKDCAGYAFHLHWTIEAPTSYTPSSWAIRHTGYYALSHKFLFSCLALPYNWFHQWFPF